jgi:GTP-binding protein
MKIRSVTYTGSFAAAAEFPAAEMPEFVFLGRSNVGKSSLINALVNRRNIARTSNTPGKTRTANFYLVNEAFFFVDMPGYGYAQVSKAERARWQKVIASYLEGRETLGGTIHLLDVRHTPSTSDREVTAELHRSKRPVCLVFNKVDKIGRTAVDRRVAGHLERLDANPRTAVVPFSSETGQGRKALWAWIEDCLSL